MPPIPPEKPIVLGNDIFKQIELQSARSKTPSIWDKLTLALIVVAGLGWASYGTGIVDIQHCRAALDNIGIKLGSGVKKSLSVRSKTVWQPSVDTTWQIVLRYPLVIANNQGPQPDVDAWDIDLFDNDQATIDALQDAGKHVICYFSAGSWEDWRADADKFNKADLGKTLDGWPNEKWINVSSPNVRRIMKRRIKYAAGKGCDAIDPDNVDGYQNINGLGLTRKDAINYIKFLSREAAKYGMATGLKNAGDVIPDVLRYVQFSVNEQCVQYSECGTFAAFTAVGKPVFHIEYPSGVPKVSGKTRKKLCSGRGKAAGSKDFSNVIKEMSLDGWVMFCDGTTANTTVNSR